MALTVLITLTSAGIDLDNFGLYSDTDSYVTPFETGITRGQLLGGYTSVVVPDGTTIIRATSTGLCTNSLDISIVPSTTTTTTAAPTTTTTTAVPTTTTTTTAACTATNIVALSYSVADGATACSFYPGTTVNYYLDNTALGSSGDEFWTTVGCTGVPTIGYYSDGNVSRYWGGVNWNAPVGC
jgi:hypothetical protein